MLRLLKIKKSFSGVEVLHDISFSAERGCVTALVGENGAGKSTLMKILSGVYSDYDGEVYIDDEKIFFKNPWEAKHRGISIIHQELSCIPDLTVAENIFLGKEPVGKFRFVNYPKLIRDAGAILKEFDFPYSPDTILRNISVGWQQIVEIAQALSSDAGIFILDEPTSALAESEIKILFEKIRLLKQRGKIIIFISHRLEEIYEIADEIAVMRDGLLIGKYSAAEITRGELIGKMVGNNLREIRQTESFFGDETTLQVEDLNVFDNSASYLSGITFTLMQGEILGLAGLLGSGKSELLKFLFGELKARYTGKIMFGENIYTPTSASISLKKNIIYLTKDRKTEGIFAGLDMIENSTISVLSDFSSGGFIHKSQEMEAVLIQSKELNVRFNSLHQKIETLSGGNQQKILIGRGLLNNPRLLLLDEPTRGIDIGAKEGIYNLINGLSSKGISFIISSSHMPELLRICDRILVLFNGVPAALLTARKTDTKEILHYAFNEGQL